MRKFLLQPRRVSRDIAGDPRMRVDTRITMTLTSVRGADSGTECEKRNVGACRGKQWRPGQDGANHPLSFTRKKF